MALGGPEWLKVVQNGLRAFVEGLWSLMVIRMSYIEQTTPIFLRGFCEVTLRLQASVRSSGLLIFQHLIALVVSVVFHSQLQH